MQYMASLPDKSFDLAVVDPPYGIHDRILKGGRTGKVLFGALYEKKQWDIKPDREYFNELFRVSKNQIICGGNYFTDMIPPSRGWVIWDKLCEGMTTVNPELIWTSFDVAPKIFKRGHGLDKGFMNKEGKNIHPTQKTPHLYKWLLENFAKEGMRILDTHLGSGSSAIVAEKMGFEFVGCEIDEEYYAAAVARYERECDLGLFQTDAIADEGSVGKKLLKPDMSLKNDIQAKLL